jgi:hypothetical protein
MKDSFVNAPNVTIDGSSQNLRSDTPQRRARRKNPSPASTKPASLRFGTQKLTMYNSDATNEVA